MEYQKLSLGRWWKKVDLNAKLPYLRDRVVESCIWSLTLRSEPQYSNARLIYATLDEGDLFNEPFQRWDIKEIDHLPDYMKIPYKFILQEYEEFKEEATKQGKPFAVHYAIEAVKEVSRAYHRELEWFRGAKMMPTFEEYMANTEITSCIKMMHSIVVPYMKSVSEESIKCLTSEPRHKMLVAASNTLRYFQDAVGHDRKRKDGQVLTSIEWYMNDHGISEEEAVEKFGELAEASWKDVNAEWLVETCMPNDFYDGLVNYARAGWATYGKGVDNFTFPQKQFAPLVQTLLNYSTSNHLIIEISIHLL